MVRELSLSWGHFPITSSLAEVRINLTIPVLSAGHLKALHDGLGETEALKEHFLPPSSPPWPRGQLPFGQQHPEQGQAAAQTSYWRRRLG